ncbi:PE-PGRS family protein PE_PGRS26-like [Pollicipes pollicipes]|uniref:PE-PGRS family protein PE_PGRS26-like n=1 Tax=Pollicipes pollicipes TaxID=41117 RepID=UPI0018850292|nr:PE-PGRS family protein PE_PGRS26-like [Pollicipes pollicipes]
MGVCASSDAGGVVSPGPGSRQPGATANGGEDAGGVNPAAELIPSNPFSGGGGGLLGQPLPQLDKLKQNGSEAASGAFGGIRAGASDAMGQAKGAAGNAMDSAKDAAGNAMDSAKNAAGDAVNSAKDAAGDAVNSAKDAAGDALDSAKDAAGNAMNSAKDAAGDANELG